MVPNPASNMASSLFVAALLVTGAVAQQSVWGQCGGIGWSGPTTCTSGNTCTKQNDYYYQCIPGGSGGGATTTTRTTTSQPSTPTGGNGGGNSGKTQYFGVNIAGFVSPLFASLMIGSNCDLEGLWLRDHWNMHDQQDLPAFERLHWCE